MPKRHLTTCFDATPWDQQSAWPRVEAVKHLLDEQHAPDGFNAGEAGGQTVAHLHIHVIPRYRGNMVDPTGSLRGLIPEKQKYNLNPASVEHGVTDPFSQLSTFVLGPMQRHRRTRWSGKTSS